MDASNGVVVDARVRAGRGGRVALVGLLVGAALASGAEAAPSESGASGRVERVGPGVPEARVVVEGGRAFGRALLVVEGEGRWAAEALALDGRGAYVRTLDSGALDGVETVRLVVQERAGALASGFVTEIRRHHRPPTAGPVPSVSALVVTEIMKDPVWVSDAFGEWFEVVNTGTQPVDLEGWSISDQGSNLHVLQNGGAGLVVAPGQRFVLGNQDDPLLNGGVLVDYRYSNFSLSNGADEVILHDAAGVLVDQVLYDGGTLWPDNPGVSLNLSPTAMGPMSNDDPANWCDASSQIGPANPDLGSPGAPNDACP